MEGRGREREFPPSLPPHQASDMEPWFGAPQGPSVWAQGSESCCITALSLVWPNLVEYSQSLQRGAIPPAPPRSLLRRSVVHKSRSWRHLCNFEKKRKRGRDRVSLSLGGRGRAGTLFLLCSKTGRNFALPLSFSLKRLSICGGRKRRVIIGAIIYNPFGMVWDEAAHAYPNPLASFLHMVVGACFKGAWPRAEEQTTCPTDRPTDPPTDSDRRCVSRTIDFSPFL